MLSNLSEWWRSHRAVWRAQKMLGAARRLRNDGKVDRGLELAAEAFEILGLECDRAAHPAAKSVLAVETMLFDQLCCDVGDTRRAQPQLLLALELCEHVVRVSQKREPSIRPYIAWYRQRLAAIAHSSL